MSQELNNEPEVHEYDELVFGEVSKNYTVTFTLIVGIQAINVKQQDIRMVVWQHSYVGNAYFGIEQKVTCQCVKNLPLSICFVSHLGFYFCACDCSVRISYIRVTVLLEYFDHTAKPPLRGIICIGYSLHLPAM